MKITCCPKEEKKEIVTILIDESPWRDVHIAIFGRRPKLPSQVNTWEEWQEIFNMHEYQQTKQYVLRRLAAQNYHSNQLKKLLAERCVQVSTINRVVADCLGWGYLNDAAWLESFVRSRLKRQGAQAILSKLYAKGIPLDTARAEIEKWQNPDQEAEAISKLLRTRFRSKNLQDRKERQKVIASLMRKGFKLSAIQHAMQNMPQEEDFF